jgi:hypothetical protein
MATEYELFVDIQNKLAITQLGVVFIMFGIIAVFFLFSPFIWVVISKMFGRKAITMVCDKSHNLKLKSGYTLKNGMLRKGADFYYKKFRGTFFINRLPMEFIGLDSAFVQNPFYNPFIIELIDYGYKNYQFLLNALNKYQRETIEGVATDDVTRNAIDDFMYAKNPLELSSTSDLYAPGFSNLPLDITSDFGSTHMPASINAFVENRMIFHQDPVDETLLEMYGPLIMLIVFVLVGGALAYTMVSTVVK